MNRVLFPLMVFLLASCGPGASPPPSATGQKRFQLANRGPDLVPEDAPSPQPAPIALAPKPSTGATFPDRSSDDNAHHVTLNLTLDPKATRQEDLPTFQKPLPAFTFRTMDHSHVDVRVNGQRIGSTSCLWSIAASIQFDPKIPVSSWPPPRAKFIGSTKRMSENGGGVAELWIAGGDGVRADLPHLLGGEHVLYVKGHIAGCVLLGGLRLYVGKPDLSYRFTDYNPVMDMESDGASQFLRTLWFEPVREE